MMFPIRTTAAFLVVFLAALLPVRAQEPGILTVSGAIEKSNRPAVAKDSDTLFSFMGATFDKGYVFTRSELAALPQVTYEVQILGTKERGHFTGPLLADVLAAVGAKGEKVRLFALDGGYWQDMSYGFMETFKPIVGISSDKALMNIGDFGPTIIVLPESNDPEMQETFDRLTIWGLFQISVE